MRPKWFQADPKSRYHRQSQWYQEGTWNGPENQTMSGKALAANPGSKPKATRPSLASGRDRERTEAARRLLVDDLSKQGRRHENLSDSFCQCACAARRLNG
jgi:hypothetical protein